MLPTLLFDCHDNTPQPYLTSAALLGPHPFSYPLQSPCFRPRRRHPTYLIKRVHLPVDCSYSKRSHSNAIAGLCNINREPCTLSAWSNGLNRTVYLRKQKRVFPNMLCNRREGNSPLLAFARPGFHLRERKLGLRNGCRSHRGFGDVWASILCESEMRS